MKMVWWYDTSAGSAANYDGLALVQEQERICGMSFLFDNRFISGLGQTCWYICKVHLNMKIDVDVHAYVTGIQIKPQFRIWPLPTEWGPRDGCCDGESFLSLPVKIRGISIDWWYSGEMVGEGNNKHNDDGDGLLSFFISNDFPIVFFSVHALSLFGVFVHAADPFPHLFFFIFLFVWGCVEGLYSSASSLLSSSRRCFLLFR